MKKTKLMLRTIAVFLSAVIMLTVLPLGAFAADTPSVTPDPSVNAVLDQADSTETYAKDSADLDENADSAEKWTVKDSLVPSDIEFDSESTPEPLSQTELTTIIENGKMERISADNVPDVVGFETAKSRNHVARAYEKEKDDLNSLIFLNEDGTYTKYIYDYPVKFKDENGKIKDTSLQVISDSKGGYKRKQGDSTAHFSEKMSDGIGLSSDELSVSLIPKPSTFVKPKPNLSQVASKKLSGLLQSTDKVNSLDNKTVSYYYNDSTTLEYSLTYLGFKEDIVVSEYTGQTEYVFTLKTNGLALTETDGNFYLTDDQGNIKVSLGQVIIFTADERNNTFGSMTAETVTENQEYTITLHVDADWLKDEKTAYPIRIDPTLELVNQEDSLVEDVVINSDNTISNRYTEALKVGKNEDGTYSRILIKFNYDFGSFANGPLKIHRAYVEMRDLMCEPESMTVMSEMFVNSDWHEDSDWVDFGNGTNTHYMASMPIKWDKGVSLAEPHRYSISILDAMKYWVAEANNTPNYHHEYPYGGIMIKAYDKVEQGNTTITKSFGSSNNPTSAYRPSLSVTYYDQHTQYSDPFGHLDAVTSDSIRGWVWCVDLPEQSVPVTIYLKNETTDVEYPGITLSGKDTALHRPDVENAGYGTGCYGFNYPIDWSKYSAGKYTVTAKWHSMNGTTLQYKLNNAPMEYENQQIPPEYTQFLPEDTYYINNDQFGCFLTSSINHDTTFFLSAQHGDLASLGTKISWKLTKYNGGYTIQSSLQSSLFLSCGSGVDSDIPMITQISEDIPLQCVWDIQLFGGVLLKNRYNSKFLYYDGNLLRFSLQSDNSSEDSNISTVWNIISTAKYLSGPGNETDYELDIMREISRECEFSDITVAYGCKASIDRNKFADNMLWTNFDDFEYEIIGDGISIDNKNGTISAVYKMDISNLPVYVTHKITGYSFRFFVNVVEDWGESGGNISSWYCDEMSYFGYWQTSPSLYVNNLSSDSSFCFSSATINAINSWENILPISFQYANNKSADICIYGGTRSEIIEELDYDETDISPNVLGITKFDTELDAVYICPGNLSKFGFKMKHAEVIILSKGNSEQSVHSTTMHEFGHALGYLGHTTSYSDVMFPTAASEATELSYRERAHIQCIYNLKHN